MGRQSQRMITAKGKTMTIREWSAATGIKAATIRKRISNGMTGADILTPVQADRLAWGETRKLITMSDLWATKDWFTADDMTAATGLARKQVGQYLGVLKTDGLCEVRRIAGTTSFEFRMIPVEIHDAFCKPWRSKSNEELGIVGISPPRLGIHEAALNHGEVSCR